VFLLVPAHPGMAGSPGQRAIKWFLLFVVMVKYNLQCIITVY